MVGPIAVFKYKRLHYNRSTNFIPESKTNMAKSIGTAFCAILPLPPPFVCLLRDFLEGEKGFLRECDCTTNNINEHNYVDFLAGFTISL